MNTHADVYERLATVLDTLPNGFPRTETGEEIAL
jgi:predicted nucleic acid-binding OB-fold protein